MYIGATMRVAFALLIYLLILLPNAMAQVRMSELEDKIWLAFSATYLQVDNDSIPVQGIVNGEYDHLMKPINERILNVGYSNATFWVRIEIENDLNYDVEPVIQLIGPNLNDVSLFEAKGTGMTYPPRGLDYPHDPSLMISGSYIYPLLIESGQTNVYYFKAHNNVASLRMPLLLWKRLSYETMQNHKSMIMGIFMGILLIIMLVSAIAWIYMQEAIYFWYLLYLIAMTITLTLGQALLFELFWPDHPQYNDTATVLFPLFAMITLTRFSQVFLNTEKEHPIIHKIGLVGIALFCIMAFSWLIRDVLEPIRPVLMFFYSITPFTILVSYWLAGIIGSIRGSSDSKMFLLAFSPMLLLSIGILLRNNDLFPHFGLFEYNIPIGFTCEAIVFSAALANRIQRVRKEKEQLLKQLNNLQAQRFRNVIEAVENERKRIAIDLHDSLGQLLSTAKLNVSVWGDQVAEGDEENYETSMKLLDQACNEVREISSTMMPSTLIRLGFLSALKELVANINMADKIQVKLEVNEFTSRLDETRSISLYRICQEILNNAIKYSEADEMVIRITESNDRLFLFLKDNGVGFDTQKLDDSSGLGWSNIFSRISMLNGHIRVFSDGSVGTSVHIDVPL